MSPINKEVLLDRINSMTSEELADIFNKASEAANMAYKKFYTSLNEAERDQLKRCEHCAHYKMCEYRQGIDFPMDFDIPCADYIEIVRCEDCIHYDLGVCLKIYSDGDVSQYAWQERKPDDFCSYGKRKAERTCETCYANDMEVDAVDNPCWNCKGDDNPMWRSKEE